MGNLFAHADNDAMRPEPHGQENLPILPLWSFIDYFAAINFVQKSVTLYASP